MSNRVNGHCMVVFLGEKMYFKLEILGKVNQNYLVSVCVSSSILFARLIVKYCDPTRREAVRGRVVF